MDVDADRRPSNNTDQTKCTDDNLDYRIGEFKNYTFKKILNLGLVNFAIKTDTKLLFSLQRNMNKLFETRAKADNIPNEPDALIQFHDRPYIAYQEINLTQTFDIYLSKNSLNG